MSLCSVAVLLSFLLLFWSLSMLSLSLVVVTVVVVIVVVDVAVMMIVVVVFVRSDSCMTCVVAVALHWVCCLFCFSFARSSCSLLLTRCTNLVLRLLK